jgi:trk system potassium uptake protein TrkA
MATERKVVIGGAGTVGSHIAAMLEQDEYDVVVIDEDPKALREIEEELDIQTVLGHAASPRILSRVGIEEAALMLALTDSDEVNLLAAFSAKQLGAKKTVARARSPWCVDASLVDFRTRLHIDLVLNPEILTAVEIIKFLDNPDALALAHFAQGKVQLRQFILDAQSRFVGMALKDCDLPQGVLVVMRSNGERVDIPKGDTVLDAGDRLTIMGQPEHLPEAQQMFRFAREPARKITIAGGGNTGMFLAQTLEARNFHVKLIEVDETRCHYLSEHLERTRIVRGDATRSGFLKEERVSASDVFIGVTNYDEPNLMSCLVAKDLGVRQTIARVTRPDYTPLLRQLGVDLAISPRTVIADRILAMVRRGKVSAVSVLEDGKVEVVEYVAQAGSPMVGRPLSETRLPKGALIGAIVQRGRARVPRGYDKILPGDTVIVIGLEGAMDDVDTLFEGKRGRNEE